MPDEPITFTDLVRGELTFTPENVPDYGIVRANGAPLYTLVNPVDDALMEITHVLRGEDLLSSTPRQIALYKALIELGIAKAVPAFGHLPYVMGEGNKKLSKRDPQASPQPLPRARLPPRGPAQLPLAARLVALRRPGRLLDRRDGRGVRHRGRQRQPGPLRPEEGRGDQRRPHPAAGREGLRRGLRPWLRAPHAPWAPEGFDRRSWEAIAPHAQTRLTVLSDITANVDFLFLDGARRGRGVLDEGDEGGLRRPAAHGPREAGRRDWTSAEALKDAVLAAGEEHGLKLGKAQAPVRVAVTGRTVGLPLFESLEILGGRRRWPASTRRWRS